MTITGDGMKKWWLKISLKSYLSVRIWGHFSFWHLKEKCTTLHSFLGVFIHEFSDWRHPSARSHCCDYGPPQEEEWGSWFPLVLQSSKSLALFRHIYFPLTRNLLIDGWERYGKWQESLCRWFSFKYICHLAGGGMDERQLSWTLNRLKDVCGQAMPHWQGVKSKGWMIDRDLKWMRDTHLLSHHAYSHNVWNSSRRQLGLV